MPTNQRTTRAPRRNGASVAAPAKTSDRWLASELSNSLPIGLPEFVGRSRELTKVTKLVQKSRMVTLTGLAGIGKTRLAIEVAHRVNNSFADGAWFVDLAPVTDPELVAAAAIAALGLDPEPGRDPLETLTSYLDGRNLLLVLDNCEHLRASVAELAKHLRKHCSGLSMLATGQQALGIASERTEAVASLSLPEPRSNPSIGSVLESDAVRLFCTRAVARHGGFRLTDEVVPAVAEICHRLDGIPLAIELAAARTAVLGAVEIAERIEHRFDLLTDGASTAPERHQTLRAALDWSYELLTAEEATMLRRLSVFAGNPGIQAVEEICSGPEVGRNDVLDLLSSLVGKSLLVADTSQPRARYHLSETIRAYGRERLQESAEDEQVNSRLTAWCISMVEASSSQTAGGHGQLWTTAIESDHDNIRAAMAWAVTHEPRSGLRLASAMVPFWRTRGYFKEGRDWLQQMLDAEGALGQPTGPGRSAALALRAKALWGLGMMAILQGEFEPARTAVEKSLALARKAKLRRAEGQALNLLGFISIFSQDPSAAKPLLDASLTLARATGVKDALAASLSLYGRVHLFLGEVTQARSVFEQCLELSDDYPAGPRIGLGWAALAAGEERRARDLFDQTLPEAREAGERFDTALVLSFLGELAWARGDFSEARSLFEEGQELARVMGAPYPLVRCLYGLANVAVAEKDPTTALDLVEEACEIAEQRGLPYARVRALHVRGALKRAAGDAEGAKADYDEALTAARTSMDRDGEAGSMHHLAALCLDRGVDSEALSLLREALSIQADVGDSRTASFLEAIAGMGTIQGRPAHAARLFGAADALRRALGNSRRPDEVARYEADVDELRSVFSEAEFEELWAEGVALSRDEALGLAIGGRGSRDPHRPTYGWASLTPTETKVVDLAVSGFTNREIGEQLFVSDRTVQGHLSRVFRKLDVATRRELREAHRQLQG